MKQNNIINNITIVFRMPFIGVAMLAGLLFVIQALYIIKHNDIIKLHDQAFYYSYVRSALIDHDLNFTNEYEHFKVREYDLSSKGLPVNRYTIGFPLLVSPFFGLTHATITICNYFGLKLQTDGYSEPYQLAFCFGSIFYGIIGLFLCFIIIRHYYSESVSKTAVSIIALTTNIFYYFAREPYLSELCSFFTVTLFMYLWQKTLINEKRLYFLWLGLAAGLMISVRQQNAAFLVVVPIGYLWDMRSIPAAKIISSAALLFTGGLVALFPQFAAWNEIFGSPLVDSYHGYSFTYKYEPKIFEVLFSSKHGLISWHPVVLLCLTGLLLSVRSHARVAIAFIAAFLLQLYIISAWHYWWLGYSFGNRGFVSCTLIFAFGLAYLLNSDASRNHPQKAMLAVSILALWNMLLILSYLSDLIPKEDYFNWLDLFRNLVNLPEYVINKLHFSTIQE